MARAARHVAAAAPCRQTIVLCGEGGFAMLALGALATHVQGKSRVVQIGSRPYIEKVS